VAEGRVPRLTELALSAYRPFAGKGDELEAVFAEELATLRGRGHVTERRAPIVRTDTGEYLVVLEWSSEHAVGDAHEDPEVLALWERKEQLAEYIPPSELAGSDVPFARWTIVADV
jgi:heme-degrading monooxygenase HmoA